MTKRDKQIRHNAKRRGYVRLCIRCAPVNSYILEEETRGKYVHCDNCDNETDQFTKLKLKKTK